jgi:hypothetical protein
MNQLPDATTGNTTASSTETKDKQKIYWTEETESAVKEYLALEIGRAHV